MLGQGKIAKQTATNHNIIEIEYFYTSILTILSLGKADPYTTALLV